MWRGESKRNIITPTARLYAWPSLLGISFMLNSLPSNLPQSQSTSTRQCKQKLYWRLGQNATSEKHGERVNEERKLNENSTMCSAHTNLWSVFWIIVTGNQAHKVFWHYFVCNDQKHMESVYEETAADISHSTYPSHGKHW